MQNIFLIIEIGVFIGFPVLCTVYKLRDAIGIIILISSRACEMLFTETVYYRAAFAINPQIYPTTAFPISSCKLVYALCRDTSLWL